MPPTVARIGVAVTARTDKFTRGMKRARKSMGGFTASVKRATRAATKYGSILTGVAVAGATIMIKRSFDTIDALAKTSDRLGVATEKLQALEYAAKISGMELTVFNKALQNVVRQVAEASTGTGEALDALKALGLAATDLVKLSPDKMLERIADALMRVEDANIRVGIAADLFGMRGVKMMNLMQNGAKGIRDLVAQFKELRVGINRVDAAKVEAANDAMESLRTAVKGMSDVVSTYLATPVKDAADKLTGFVSQYKDIDEKLIPAFRRVGDVVGDIVDGIERITRFVGWFARQREEARLGWTRLLQKITDFAGAPALGPRGQIVPITQRQIGRNLTRTEREQITGTGLAPMLPGAPPGAPTGKYGKAVRDWARRTTRPGVPEPGALGPMGPPQPMLSALGEAFPGAQQIGQAIAQAFTEAWRGPSGADIRRGPKWTTPPANPEERKYRQDMVRETKLIRQYLSIPRPAYTD